MKTVVLGAFLASMFFASANAQIVETPKPSDVYPYTPDLAVRNGRSGQATVRCVVQEDGSLRRCAVVSEAPMGYAFGAASIHAAQHLYKAKRPSEGGSPTVDVPFSWNEH